jgi:probable rRNA maturation factor
MKKQPLDIHLQIIDSRDTLPSKSQFTLWVSVALDECSITEPYELTIRIVSKAEIQQLNKTYRKCDAPTDILSFQDEFIPGCLQESLGELVVCPDVIEADARTEKLGLQAHWAHIIIHGILHLLNYDHDTDVKAAEMEHLESIILARLNIPSPF